jgi:NhaA family Na+:H+ antiporter
MILELLIAIFFFFIGLEIRSTLTHIKEVAVPALAALGGMIFPATIYLLFATDSSAWASTMPTDIALALAIVALLGKRVSPAVRLFLLTLAVADDLLSLIALALFYSDQLDYLHSSATLGASSLGILCASVPKFPVAKVISFLAPISTYLIIPIYIAAKFLEGFDLSSLGERNLWIFVAARSLGKVAGITLFALLAHSFTLHKSIDSRGIIGVGLLSGMGLTVSLVIADIALTYDSALADVRAALVISALISGALGFAWFKRFPAS